MAELTFPRKVDTTFGQTIDPCTESEFRDLVAQGVVAKHSPTKAEVSTDVEVSTPYAPTGEDDTEDEGTTPPPAEKKG